MERSVPPIVEHRKVLLQVPLQGAMCGPRASGITPYGCSSVTVLYMSQPLSASHCLVYLRIPLLTSHLVSGVYLFSVLLCVTFLLVPIATFLG